MRMHVVTIILLSNALLWLCAGVQLAVTSVPYHPPVPQLHPDGPQYVILWRMNAPGERVARMWAVRAAMTVSLPIGAFVSVLPPQQMFSSDRLYLGTSLTGYKIMAMGILSFIQWYIIGTFLQRQWDKKFSRGG